MSIRYLHGNLFDAQAEALVNPVNCRGTMGKGLALQFRQRFPAMYDHYVALCRNGEVEPGVLHSFVENGVRIINFPTKNDWREPSRLEYIEDGLKALQRMITECGLRSIAIPPLGCGLGGLDWNTVREMIVSALEGIGEDVDVQIFGPHRLPFKVKERYKNPRIIGEELKPGESSFYGSGRIPAERLRAERLSGHRK